jgi:hypothetical protein
MLVAYILPLGPVPELDRLDLVPLLGGAPAGGACLLDGFQLIVLGIVDI